MMNPIFSLKKTTLGLLLLACALGEVNAILTSKTKVIHGEKPEIKSKINGNNGFDLLTTAKDVLKTGDEITLSYIYIDPDGDEDNSTEAVEWYAIIDGKERRIHNDHIKNVNADSTQNGESKLTIPTSVAGASNFKVSITATSKSGIPKSGESFSNDNVFGALSIPFELKRVSLNPEDTIAGIYASTDSSFSHNLISGSEPIKVGKTYVFKLFKNNSGIADLTVDLTSRVEKYDWRLLGSSVSGDSTFPKDGFHTGISNADFTVPKNAEAKEITGSNDGAQGFNLAVDWN